MKNAKYKIKQQQKKTDKKRHPCPPDWELERWADYTTSVNKLGKHRKRKSSPGGLWHKHMRTLLDKSMWKR